MSAGCGGGLGFAWKRKGLGRREEERGSWLEEGARREQQQQVTNGGRTSGVSWIQERESWPAGCRQAGGRPQHVRICAVQLQTHRQQLLLLNDLVNQAAVLCRLGKPAHVLRLADDLVVGVRVSDHGQCAAAPSDRRNFTQKKIHVTHHNRNY